MKQKLQDFLEEYINQHIEAASFQFISENGSEIIKNSDLIARAKELAQCLKKIGFQAKDRAVLLSENSLEWMICYLAVLYADGVVATLDTELLPDNTCSLVKKMDPVIIFCSENQIRKLESLHDEKIPVVVLQAFEKIITTFAALPTINRKDSNDYDENIAAIVNSSGTGGRLKGILLTHKNIIDVVTFYKNEFNTININSILCVLPCYAIYPCAICLAALANGMPVYFADVKKLGLLTILQQQPISCIPFVPLGIMTIHSKITQAVSEKGKFKVKMFWLLTTVSCLLRQYFHINIGKKLFPSIHKALGSQLEFMLTGGAPLNAEITKDFYSWGYTIKEGYGLTETAGVITATDSSFSAIGSCGKALKDVTIALDHPDKENYGEILISGSRLMAGYFRDPEANEKALLQGVFRTGDLGKFDTKGNLHILGRTKEIILHSDERKTLPQDVEIRYQSLEGIEKLAVVGIKDNITQCDVIYAAIVPNEKLLREYNRDMTVIKKRIEKLIFQRAAELPQYLQIVHVNIFDSLPTNALGKIKRSEIKDKIIEMNSKSPIT